MTMKGKRHLLIDLAVSFYTITYETEKPRGDPVRCHLGLHGAEGREMVCALRPEAAGSWFPGLDRHRGLGPEVQTAGTFSAGAFAQPPSTLLPWRG